MNVLPAASVVMLASPPLLPMAPPIVVMPAVLTVRCEWAESMPLIVPLNEMAPPAVDVSVTSATLTEFLYAWPPVVVTEPPESLVTPLVPVAMLDSGVVAPIAPPNVVSPEVLGSSDHAPSTVLANVMFPPPVEALKRLLVSVTASLNVCAPLVVNFPAPIDVLPAASVVTDVSGWALPKPLPDEPSVVTPDV